MGTNFQRNDFWDRLGAGAGVGGRVGEAQELVVING